MKNPCAKLFIWLLFSLLSIPSALMGTSFTVSMDESLGNGQGPNDYYSSTNPLCLIEQNGVVSISFSPTINFSVSNPDPTTSFQLLCSVYGVDPNDKSNLIPVPLAYSSGIPTISWYDPTYYSVSNIASPINNYVNFSAQLSFNPIQTFEPSICEYIIKMEVYSPSSEGAMEIYDPLEPGYGIQFYYGNMILCGDDRLLCEAQYSNGNNGEEPSELRFTSKSYSQLEIKSIQPNPASTSAIVNFTSLKSTEVNILDLQGRRIDIPQLSVKFIAGEHTIKIPLESFASGIYFVQVRSGSELNTQKLVVVD